MTDREPRLLLDECLPKPFVERLAKFVESQGGVRPVVRHLFDYAPSGTRDEDWIPRLKDEGWTIISADGGKRPNRNRGKKLPQLCAECGITLILLSSAVHNRKSFDKTRTILSVWDQIVEIAADPSRRGKLYRLEPLNASNLGVGRLVEKPVRLPPDPERTV